MSERAGGERRVWSAQVRDGGGVSERAGGERRVWGAQVRDGGG